jgi:hypothetical protein
VTRDYILAGKRLQFHVHVPPEMCRTIPCPAFLTFVVEKLEPNGKYARTTWLVKMLAWAGLLYVGKLDDFTGQVELTEHSHRLMRQGAGERIVKLLNHLLARIWCDDHEAYERHGIKVTPQEAFRSPTGSRAWRNHPSPQVRLGNFHEGIIMTTFSRRAAPGETARACWLHKPIAPPCELSPQGLPGLLLATKPDGRALRHDDLLLVTYRTDAAGKVVGYRVARSNQRTFDFDGAVPEPAAIVLAVEVLDPPPAPAPFLPFRSAADYAANNPEGYRRQCEEVDGNGPDKAA